MAKRVTIQDIADELGISRNTVSKALNNADGLAEATRVRVLEKAIEMGYKHLAYASSVADFQNLAGRPTSGSTPTEIALFVSSFLSSSHFASLMLDRLQYELAQMGYTLNTHRVSEENVEQRSLPLTFGRERTAAIMCVEMFDYAYDMMLCELGLPTLFVDGPAILDTDPLPSDVLLMDNEYAIASLLRQVLASGRTNVGFIGDFSHCQSFWERYTATRFALHMAGHSLDERFVIKRNHKEDIAGRLAELDRLPDLFVCANDFVALDALQALRELGHEVPRDVMISGFDDSTESRACMPPLTTIHIHTQIMAFSAMHLLISRIKEPSLDFRRVHTETNLIVRDSTPLSLS